MAAEYDASSGENRFAWILRVSAELRAERIAADAITRAGLRQSLDDARRHDEQLEREDRGRLSALRARYDANRGASQRLSKAFSPKTGETPPTGEKKRA